MRKNRIKVKGIPYGYEITKIDARNSRPALGDSEGEIMVIFECSVSLKKSDSQKKYYKFPCIN